MIEYYKQIIEKHIIENIDHCDSYAFEFFSKSIDDFFCNISNEKNPNLNYSKEYSIEEIFEIANNFFNETDIMEIINSEPIEYYFVEKDDIELIAKYNEIGIYDTVSRLSENGASVIIFLKNTLADAYKLIHETIHAIICDYTGMKEQKLIEVLPIISELYLSDYLKKIGNEENHINEKTRKEYIQTYLPNSSWEKIYLNQVLKDGKINNFHHSDELIISFANDLENRKKLYIHETEKYLLGMMFASYIHQNMDINKFIELCTKIKNMNFKEFFEFINLNNLDGKIDECGYQKIFKSYERDYMHE